MMNIVKTTSKGQVTLPMRWRKKFPANRYTIKEVDDTLIIAPLEIESLEDENWRTVFDAKRDHEGKGIPVDQLIRLLKRTL
ncbi:MAG: AbrB/MazE/SpoVT family DNA-binding domain-containing protein [Patescibacteria group bacterium]